MTGNIWRLLLFKFTEFIETVFLIIKKIGEFSMKRSDTVKR